MFGVNQGVVVLRPSQAIKQLEDPLFKNESRLNHKMAAVVTINDPTKSRIGYTPPEAITRRIEIRCEVSTIMGAGCFSDTQARQLVKFVGENCDIKTWAVVSDDQPAGHAVANYIREVVLPTEFDPNSLRESNKIIQHKLYKEALLLWEMANGVGASTKQALALKANQLPRKIVVGLK